MKTKVQTAKTVSRKFRQRPFFEWSTDIVIIDANEPAGIAFARIDRAEQHWIIVSRNGGFHLYAFTRDEIRQLLSSADDQELASGSLEAILRLQDDQCSAVAENRGDFEPDAKTLPFSWRDILTTRCVEIDRNHTPTAVGAIPDSRVDLLSRLLGIRWAFRNTRSGARSPEPQSAVRDSEVSALRYPLIDSNDPIVPGGRVAITVNLVRNQSWQSNAGRLIIDTLPVGWKTFELSAIVSCDGIDFSECDRQTVTVLRDVDSVPVVFAGSVREKAPLGRIATVIVNFFYRSRYCGSAFRNFIIGEKRGTVPPGTGGIVGANPSAALPDVTVRIFSVSEKELMWIVATERVEGLPPQLREGMKLNETPQSEAAALFSNYANLTPGCHVPSIEGLGNKLWQKTPPMFRDSYWALVDHYKRPLSIQFITDEPHLPWELMRPARQDESEVHHTLSLQHNVARWIERWDGLMRNEIPAGGIFTIAPRYKSLSRRLPRAITESKILIQKFKAQKVNGTLREVTELLEDSSPQKVAVLHFAGHGQFSRTAATESSIKLEDGDLPASAVNRPDVKLGSSCRTVVFFNACEVGSSGSLFGEIGGWADTLLGRKFGGFIAPLWSVEDEDASTVATEFFQGVAVQQKSIAEVLRDIRLTHGSISPTFYSYLFYGDVTARLHL